MKKNQLTMRLLLLSFFVALVCSAQAQNLELPAPEGGFDMPLMKALQMRQTSRNLTEEDISLEELSGLVWSAYGFNRPEEKKRTAPSARNMQELDIYVFSMKGIYLYNAEKNSLELVLKGDHRKEISKQKFFAIAPISIVIVANYDRMKDLKSEDRDFYAAVDCGYVSQNIYLYCAADKLGTVACAYIERDMLSKLLHIKNGKALLAHPVGHIAR